MEKLSKGVKIRLALFASGSGTNVENFINYFKDHDFIEIALVVTNNPKAGVIQRAQSYNVPLEIMSRSEWINGNQPLKVLRNNKINFIVLAGFLQLIPGSIIEEFPERIVNIHPALLPGFGGKGMYGMSVHRAVIEAGERFSGVSIHLVNDKYDEGQLLFQEKIPVDSGDTPESLAGKIHELEYRHFPEVVENYIRSLLKE